MHCPECGTANELSHDFCQECGASLREARQHIQSAAPPPPSSPPPTRAGAEGGIPGVPPPPVASPEPAPPRPAAVPTDASSSPQQGPRQRTPGRSAAAVGVESGARAPGPPTQGQTQPTARPHRGTPPRPSPAVRPTGPAPAGVRSVEAADGTTYECGHCAWPVEGSVFPTRCSQCGQAFGAQGTAQGSRPSTSRTRQSNLRWAVGGIVLFCLAVLVISGLSQRNAGAPPPPSQASYEQGAYSQQSQPTQTYQQPVQQYQQPQQAYRQPQTGGENPNGPVTVGADGVPPGYTPTGPPRQFGRDGLRDSTGMPYDKYGRTKCSWCRGTGVCSSCGGRGRDNVGVESLEQQCNMCSGTGRCSRCGGRGE